MVARAEPTAAAAVREQNNPRGGGRDIQFAFEVRLLDWDADAAGQRLRFLVLRLRSHVGSFVLFASACRVRIARSARPGI
jgi:hypothetical protein